MIRRNGRVGGHAPFATLETVLKASALIASQYGFSFGPSLLLPAGELRTEPFVIPKAGTNNMRRHFFKCAGAHLWAFSIRPSGSNLPILENCTWSETDDVNDLLFLYDWEPSDFLAMARELAKTGFYVFGTWPKQMNGERPPVRKLVPSSDPLHTNPAA